MMLRGRVVTIALLMALSYTTLASAAVPDFPLTPKGKVPPFTPKGESGQWALWGSYRAYGNNLGNNWRYNGWQVVGVNLTGGQDAWKYSWAFEGPWSDKGGEGFWNSATSQSYEIGYSSLYPMKAKAPYVNAYVLNTTTGNWLCYHIPVPKHFTNDFLTTSTASNGQVNGTYQVPADWATFLGDGNLFQLKGGVFDKEVVRMYLNTDRWFQCPRCGVLTAMSVTNGLMLRQIFMQPTIDFYTDYYDWQPFKSSNPNFIKAFDYTPAIQGVQCRDITNGKMSCWNSTGTTACPK